MHRHFSDSYKRCSPPNELSLSKIRGQCDDGASSMAGSRSGVATKLSHDEDRAVYTHCYGHALNLACSDTINRPRY